MRWSLRKTINVKWKCMHSWITKTISTKLSLSLSLSELPLSFCKLDLVHLSTYIWGWSPMPDLFWDLQYLLRYKYYNKFEYVVFYRWGALLSSLTVNVHGYTLRSGVFQGMIMYKLIYYLPFRTRLILICIMWQPWPHGKCVSSSSMCTAVGTLPSKAKEVPVVF